MNAFGLRSFLNWSVGVGRPFGIPVRIHITILFFLLPALRGHGVPLWFLIEYAVGIVLSILLHELGHALAAKRYGLTGLSIMLHGFGGFATSSGYRSPRQALVVTLAGPAATFATGIVCLVASMVGGQNVPLGSPWWLQFLVLHVLGRTNILLGFLNLIPVLPWDGANALQAILSHRMSDFKATRRAAHVGLALAPVLLVYGLLSDQPFFGLFSLVGLLTCYATLANSGGVRFGEAFAARRSRKEMDAVRKREAARQDEYLSEVKQREKERDERERLRKILGESGFD